VDDTAGPQSDAERYRTLLNKDGELCVSLIRPDRAHLLVREGELEEGVDGYILDINLSDQVDEDGNRFLGTGAGLAQDLRLLQALGPAEGQRARPVVRLCAAQVFQAYLAGDNSTADIFDLGFDKETIGDIASVARAKLVALPEIYSAIIAVGGDSTAAPKILGLDPKPYGGLHSRFRDALEAELTRKPHEAVSFLLRQFLDAPGLLINEDMLAVRLGVDLTRSPGWPKVRDRLAAASYVGVGSAGFTRWWSDKLMTALSELHAQPFFRLSAGERVAALEAAGLNQLVPLDENAASPGDRPWHISLSEDPALRLPADPRFAFQLSSGVAPWLDEPLWCLEQAKRNRRSPLMAQDARDRLKATLLRSDGAVGSVA
jgi:hypothetical protein